MDRSTDDPVEGPIGLVVKALVIGDARHVHLADPLHAISTKVPAFDRPAGRQRIHRERRIRVAAGDADKQRPVNLIIEPDADAHGARRKIRRPCCAIALERGRAAKA